MSEKLPTNNPEQNGSVPEQAQELNEALEGQRNERAREAKETLGSDSEKAREAAEKLAITQETNRAAEQQAKEPKKDRRGAPSKMELNESFDDTMKQVRSQMKAPSRAFSKVIHAKPVEKTSEVVGATVARPNALLAGGIGAFIITLAVYLVARHFGYPLSGFETIGSFVLGWIIGMLIDYVRVLASGGRRR